MSVGIAAYDIKNVEVSELTTNTVIVRFDDGELNTVTLFIRPDDLSPFANKLMDAAVEMIAIATKDEPADGVFSAMGIDGEPAVPAISKTTE